MKKKITIDAHPSVVIAHCEKAKKLLMAVYDGGYPQVSYRFSANNIGGNPIPDDGSPINVLLTEVKDEYNPKHGEKTKFGEKVLWSPPEHINLVRGALIKRVVPYQDFLVRAVQLPSDPTTQSYDAVFSVFYSQINQEVIEIVESDLRRSRRLCTEGLTGIFTIDELTNDSVRGALSTAHATAPILNHYFGSNIPFPTELKAEAIGDVRASFRDYLMDFAYADKIARATGLKK